MLPGGRTLVQQLRRRVAEVGVTDLAIVQGLLIGPALSFMGGSQVAPAFWSSHDASSGLPRGPSACSSMASELPSPAPSASRSSIQSNSFGGVSWQVNDWYFSR